MATEVNEVKPAPPAPQPPAAAPRRRGRKRVAALVAIVALGVAAFVWVIPWARHAMGHVTTDDAIVNGHVTYVAPRVAGHVDAVLVDDNQYVEKGAALLTIDPKPLQLVVDQRRAALAQAKMSVDQQVAALETARVELDQARSQARGQIAGLRGAWYLLLAVQDIVRYETAALQSAAANVKLQQANLTMMQKQQAHALEVQGGALSQEERDQREANLEMSRQQLNVAQQSVQQTRALLGLPPQTEDPTKVPPDVGQQFSGAKYAQAQAEQILANLGVNFDLGGLRQTDLAAKILSLASDATIEQVPGVRAAQAKVHQALAALGGKAFDPSKPYDHPAVLRAEKDLEDAQLHLSYTRVTAPISGYVSRRSVNPGAQVQVGQSLMALRALDDVWVEANFKETQLNDLRIGQAVDIKVDAYPGRTFHGRVAGFSPGTGAVLSLLPPENATGNFVKVVQRLPVRIELTEPNPRDTPLFTGLSVEPEVDLHAQPTGPDAGQRLRAAVAATPLPATEPVAGVSR